VPVLRLTLAYDGGDFHGWARQPGLRTVEGVLTDALAARLGTLLGVRCAGRTDTGVHAEAQVVSVVVPDEAVRSGRTAPRRLHGQLLADLPDDLVVLSIEPAGDRFDARFDARWRRYRYEVTARPGADPLRRRYALHVPYPVDVAAMAEAAERLPGVHDFTAFTPAQGRHAARWRTVRRAGWTRDGDRLTFRIEADSFLHHMVRVLVGTMLRIGRGTWEPSYMSTLLEPGRSRSEAGETAAAHGLCLEAVGY
jgi:tRNA pseudouridine38-40 synthase